MKEEKNEMSFEEAMKKLGEISQQIERGDLSLDDTMTLYGKALELVKLCNAKLVSARQQVKMIEEREDGTVEFKDFAPMDKGDN